jgi:hypothetical protein
MRPTYPYLVAIFPALAGCGEAGATPENCTAAVPAFTYVKALRYAAEDVDPPPPVPQRILPARFGSILIPDRTGATHRAVPGEPRFGSFEILTAEGAPRACDTTTPCGSDQTCSAGRCSLETRYYVALPADDEQQLVKFGYKPSPNARLLTDTTNCTGGVAQNDDDPCATNVVVERCGDEGVDPGSCTEVEFPSCFTVPGSPGPGL